jgi:ankyrin repeat protein
MEWGLGIGDWGLGIGPNPQSPIPNPQSPVEHNYPVNEFISEEYQDLSHMNLLHYCIDYNHDKYAKFLVNHGNANVNTPDKDDKWTPLMYAIQKQNYNMALFLLQHGANVDHKDIDAFTPLAVAVDTNNKEIVSLILKYKPQIDVMNIIYDKFIHNFFIF